MQDAHDDDLGVSDAVVDHVALVKMRPQTRLDEVAAWADPGVMEKRLEPCLNLVNETCRRVRIILGDEGPNLGKVAFGLLGYAQCQRFFDLSCPFRMIFSASKACTRPSVIS